MVRGPLARQAGDVGICTLANSGVLAVYAIRNRILTLLHRDEQKITPDGVTSEHRLRQCG